MQADDPEVFAELKVKEIKNGRLAMISVLVSCVLVKSGPPPPWLPLVLAGLLWILLSPKNCKQNPADACAQATSSGFFACKTLGCLAGKLKYT